MNQANWRRDLLRHMGQGDFRPAKIKELARALQVSTHQYRPFRLFVRRLEEEGELVRLRGNRYGPPARLGKTNGLLRLHRRGFGFVLRTGGEADIYIAPAHLGEAADGDEVEVEILVAKGRMDGPEGRVLAVTQPSPRRVVGRLVQRGRRAWVEVEGPVPRAVDVQLAPDQVVAAGDLVVAEMDAERSWQLTEVLGDPQAPQHDFTVLAARLGLRLDFPPAVLWEVERLPEQPPIPAERRDLRALTTFTIDPIGAKDFDDALSVEALADGGYALGVHIADVSHFVEPGSAIDREAAQRGTSIYMLDRVIHMLPAALASGLCTLVPQQDRLSFSVLLRLDADGRVIEGELAEAVIHSRARLDYSQVQAFFDGQANTGVPAEVEQPLHNLLALSRLLRGRRQARGALDFDLPEARVDLDEEGVPTDLGQQPRWASHKLVEECMLAANEWVGTWCQTRGIPVLYRVHAPPDPGKLEAWAQRLAALGIEGGKEAQNDQQLIQELLRQVAERDDAFLFEQLLLRALMRAEYAPQDKGHFGLACPHYLHFTSPIRRYPDLLVHRLLKEAQKEGWKPGRWARQLPALGTQFSQLERQAEAAERAYIRRKQMRFMERFLGQTFKGRVSGVVNSGFFVAVDEWGVEGFCALRDLDDYYEFDEELLSLRGRTGGRAVEMGTTLEVAIARVDVENQRLDLQVDEASIPRTGRGKRRKGGGKKDNKRLKGRGRGALRGGRRGRAKSAQGGRRRGRGR